MWYSLFDGDLLDMLELLLHKPLDVEQQMEFEATTVEEVVELVEEVLKEPLEGLYESLVSAGNMLL